MKGEPGASGYSPGHQMQEKGSKAGQPAASGYAPGASLFENWRRLRSGPFHSSSFPQVFSRVNGSIMLRVGCVPELSFLR